MWVGVIALAGLDAETGVVMLLYLTLAHRSWTREGRLRTQDDLREAIVEGAAKRIRPKLMTVLTMLIGLRAGPVEHRHRRRRDEAHRRADDRRPRDVVPARAHRVSGHICDLEGAASRVATAF